MKEKKYNVWLIVSMIIIVLALLCMVMLTIWFVSPSADETDEGNKD